MKSGLVIVANVTERGLDDVTVNRIGYSRTDESEWIKPESDSELTEKDANDLVGLMVEGIMTVIYCAHEKGIKDSAKFMRETINRLEEVFIKPANTSVICGPEKEYSTK